MTQHAIGLFRVGFDLDGILSRTELSCLAAFKAAGLIPLTKTVEHITHFDYSKSFDPSVTPEFVREMFAQGHVFRSAPCDAGGMHCLNTLTDLGVETHIVTHRPWERARVETTEWLETFEARYSHLAFVQERSNKWDYCRDAGLDVFIEDNHNTAVMLASVVRLSLLFDRPYNREAFPPSVQRQKRLRRFYRFSEVLTFFGV